MKNNERDWLKHSLQSSRELLENLSAAKQTALENHEAFREARAFKLLGGETT